MSHAQRRPRTNHFGETVGSVPHPPIVSRTQWLVERKKLLGHEKDLTKHYDRVNAERRRLPMVKIEKDYVFDGPNGKQNLKAIFEGRQQLVVYHFMFDPAWEKGCPGCTSYVNAIGDLSMLDARDAIFVLISRAPLPKLEAYKAQKGWSLPWFSSFGTEFNYDFHVTNDEKVAPIEYNYRNKTELEANKVPNTIEGEEHGLSVFFRLDDDVFHTYSTYARGTEYLTDARALLDMTPYGRQQDFEDSPPGWPQKPTYG
jgi:predicted dithiol-disulfide oxidoreductase (DUF899 family)